MDVRYSDHLEHALVISPSDFKKLVELLQRRVGKVNIRVDCVDSIEREFKTAKDLIAYENPKSKRIQRIYLTARSDDYSKSATIVFRDSSYVGTGISIDITGREDVASRLKEKVLDVLSGMRPWYSWIARVDLVKTFAIVFIIPFIILPIFILFEWIPVSDSPPSNSANVKGSAISILFLLSTLLCFWGLHQLRGFLFPKIVFAIGQGESRFKLLEKTRWVVVIGFGVSFAAGLLLLIFK